MNAGPAGCAPSSTTPAETTAAHVQPTGTATGTAAEALFTAAHLTGSLDSTGGGAASRIYRRVIVRNTSATTCILDGYAGESMVLGPTGDRLRAPADRVANLPSWGPIMLAREGAAEARLCYTQAGNHPDCTGDGHGFRVYPPSAADSPCIHRPTTACSNTDTKLLTIGAFHP